uniref:Uncharacterized protein n=1 Tax=Anguilla anguilla TaxID=7936 RepID=A0A0E9R6R2_ANGAN
MGRVRKESEHGWKFNSLQMPNLDCPHPFRLLM